MTPTSRRARTDRRALRAGPLPAPPSRLRPSLKRQLMGPIEAAKDDRHEIQALAAGMPGAASLASARYFTARAVWTNDATRARLATKACRSKRPQRNDTRLRGRRFESSSIDGTWVGRHVGRNVGHLVKHIGNDRVLTRKIGEPVAVDLDPAKAIGSKSWIERGWSNQTFGPSAMVVRAWS